MKVRSGWIAWVLVLAGVARAALLVAYEPLAGYANQYDMIRSGACIGLYPDLPGPQRFQAMTEAPVPLYTRDAKRPELCYPSTEVAVAWLAATVYQAIHGSHAMPLRSVGLAKLGLLVAAALILAWVFHGNRVAAILHALVFALVLSDPVVTLWMNSLYTEFMALWSLYAAIGALLALALGCRGAYVVSMLLLLALAALAFSREQFALLPIGLTLLAGPWLWSRSPRMAVASTAVAIACAIVSWGLVPRPGEVRMVNRTDTYLGLVVPAAADEARALAVLGLPERCHTVVGATWYLQRGEILEEICPEVFALSSVAFMAFVREDPGVLARAVARVVPTLPQAALPYIGILAGQRLATIDALPWWLESPLHRVVSTMPLAAFALALTVCVLMAPVALLAAARRRPSSTAGHRVGALAALLLSAVIGYALLTTVFGDGRGEASRHFLPGLLAMFAAGLMALGKLAMLGAAWRSAPKLRAAQAAAVGGGIAVVGIIFLYALHWASSQPLAWGVLDEPQGRQVRGTLHLRGWALDPFGVESVDIALGAMQFRARYGDVATPALAGHYPAYKDAGRGAFALDVPAEALPHGHAPMRVTVTNRHGIVTEIDRRRLVISP